jgi:hypothetical protein
MLFVLKKHVLFAFNISGILVGSCVQFNSMCLVRICFKDLVHLFLIHFIYHLLSISHGQFKNILNIKVVNADQSGHAD